MEPLFPELLFLGSFFAPLFLRIGFAIIFVYDAWRLSRGTVAMKFRAFSALILSILFFVGMFTQLATLIGIVYVLSSIFIKKESSIFNNLPLVILSIASLLALFIAGAGFTPFPFGDLPY